MEPVRLEYQLLEDFLDEWKPMQNYYDQFLMNQIQKENTEPTNVDNYHPILESKIQILKCTILPILISQGLVSVQ